MSTEILPGVSKLAGSEKELEVVDFPGVTLHKTHQTFFYLLYFMHTYPFLKA